MKPTIAPKGPFSTLLDVVRVVASLLVVFGHCRAWFVQDYAAVSSPSVVDRLFYFFAFGHQAVVVFFVLSGWLVGGQTLIRIEGARFDLRDYSIQRSTRIWAVLVPAMLLSLLVAVACWASGTTLISAEALGANVGPETFPTDAWTQFGPLTFLGNLFGMMTLLVPCYGSNNPLWSLSHEMIFYAAAPFIGWAFLGIRRRSVAWPKAVGSLLVLVGLLALLPTEYRWTFTFWSASALCGYAMSSRVIRVGRLGKAGLFTGFFATLVVARLNILPGTISDLVVAIAFLAVLVGYRLDCALQTDSTYELPRAMRVLVDSSFSLYVIHLILVPLFATIVLDGTRLSPGLGAYGIVGSITAICVLLAAAFAQVTEKQTPRLRELLSSSSNK